jgi:hypothetical protein
MDTTELVEERDGKRVVYGYQPPMGGRHSVDSDAVSSWLVQQEERGDDPATATATAIITGLQLLFFATQEQDYDGALNANRIEDIGRAIAKSDHVRDILIGGGSGTTYTEELRSLFKWLAHNRSIERLTLLGLHNNAFDIFDYFLPFFELNNNLRCIDITHSNISKSIPTLISILSRCKMNRLEKIELSDCGIGDKTAAELINALCTIPGLRNLSDFDLRENKAKRASCQALHALLSNSECRIRTLDLSENPIDDVCMDFIISGLAAINTLKLLSISYQRRVTTTGWTKFFTAFLLNPRCTLENMDISQNSFATGGASSLGIFLSNNAQ